MNTGVRQKKTFLNLNGHSQERVYQKEKKIQSPLLGMQDQQKWVPIKDTEQRSQNLAHGALNASLVFHRTPVSKQKQEQKPELLCWLNS